MPYIIEAAICSAVLYLPFHLFLRNNAHHAANRYYLLFALILSLIIPQLSIPLTPIYIEANIVEVGQQPLPQPNPGFSLSLTELLGIVYFLGFLVSLLVFLNHLKSIYNLISKSSTRRFSNHTIVSTKNGSLVSSFMNYIFIPVEKQEQISDFEMIHELNHIRQKHSWDLILLEIYRIFFWFNPVINLYRSQIIALHEYLADQYTIDQLGKEEYQEFLICQVSNPKPSRLFHNFNSILKKRLIMMNAQKKPKRWHYLLCIPFLFSILFLFSCEEEEIFVAPLITIENSKKLDKKVSWITEPVTDTIWTIDYDTYEETIEYIQREARYFLDTIYTKDYDTGRTIHSYVKTYGVEGVDY